MQPHQSQNNPQHKPLPSELLDDLDAVYWEADPATRNFTFVSGKEDRLLGYPREKWYDDNFWVEHLHPDDHDWAPQFFWKTTRSLTSDRFDYRMVAADGRTVWIHDRITVVATGGKIEKACGLLLDVTGKKDTEAASLETRAMLSNPSRWFGTIQEVSKLRQVERELYESESRFRMCLDHASDMLMLLDQECCIIDVNKTACASLDYARAELIGQRPTFYDCAITPEQKSELLDCLVRGEAYGFETRHRRKDGSEFPVEVRIAPVKDCGNVFAISLANEITQRLNSQRILTDNYNLMSAIVNGTSDVIYAKNLDGRYLLINTAGANLFGLRVADVICRYDRDLPATEAARILMQSRDSDVNQTQMIEQEAVIDGNRSTFLSTRFSYCDSDGEVIGNIGISRDVTKLNQLADALRQSHKLEAVGRLAGGIAHDFNNLLTVILSYSELLLMSLQEGDPQRHQVNEIFKCGERAAGLVRQLLAFSRNQELQPKIVNLRQSLNDLASFLQPIVGANIQLSIDVAADVGDVKMDLDQFRQSILNLAVNARDAMPDGGKMSIKVDDFAIKSSGPGSEHAHLRPGRYARLSFSDTGIGMSESVQSHVFEPFFTTKAVGKGSGLGLSMTYGFVTQSGGHIEVSSVSGHGCTFCLYLPCASQEPQDFVPKSEVRDPSLANLDATLSAKTVLLVEDEETVRVLCCRILESCGYSVIQASDGMEAMELLQSTSQKIDLLITDVVMPRMNGPKLLEAIHRDLPQLPVIFISGYADENVLLDIPPEKRNLMRKPFSPRQLAHRVHETLDAAAKSDGDC